MRREKFIEEYVQALDRGSAGLFVGAGISMKANYPSWKALVRDMAAEVGLDVDQEPDLAGVVQYFLNKAGKTRNRLARVISAELGVEKPIPELLRTLARLPLRHIWTTNYDELLERAWREQRLQLDVKTENKHLTHDNPAAHAILYKMHGSVSVPADVVIAKGDYEAYRRKRGEFLNLLHGHLVSRHMLFLGFSFTDPNLSHLFTLIREAFDDTPRDHYAIVRRPQRGDYEGRGSKASFEYAQRRHELWVDDLQNYGIQCVVVDDWEEVDEIMSAVERRLSGSSVMVSGSYPESIPAGHLDERPRIEQVSRGVGELLAARGYRIVSGFGLVVGSAVLSGALGELYKEQAPNLDRRLFLRPFPQLIPEGLDRQEYYRRYREDLVHQAGVCVYIGGVKLDEGSLVTANGVVTEYEMLRRLARTPIPIGATGGAAAEIWEAVSNDYETVFGPMPRRSFDLLNDRNQPPEKLVSAVGDILDWLRKH